MRVYVPSTVPTLAAALDSGVVARSGTRGLAVTPSLRAALAGTSDDEELEYVVQTMAGDEALELLRADPAAPRRRVVLALEVADDQVADGSADEPGRVALDGEVRLARLASVLVDDAAAADDVAAAVSTPEDERDPDLLAEQDLLWFAVQELRDLVEGSV